MVNFALILIGLAAGVLFKRGRLLTRASAQALNVVIVYLALPALIFQVVPKLREKVPFGPAIILPISMAWLSFGIAALLFGFVGKRRGWSRGQTGAMILTVGLGNTSFVGIPLLDALYGPDSLPTILLSDQPGSFLCLATLGSITASIYSGTKAEFSAIARKVLTFPPFVSLILATLAVLLAPAWARAPIDSLCGKLSPLVVPLSLISVGLQLEASIAILRRRAGILAVGLSAKLLLTPLLLTGLYVGVLRSADFQTKITILESAMAPMIMGAILASESGLDAELASLMIGVGIPVSLVTVPGWDWLLSHVLMK